MKMTFRILIIIFVTSWLLAEEQFPAIVIDQFNIIKPNLEKARQEYSRKVKNEHDKFVKAIELSLVRETKAGRFDNAMALRGALEKVKSGDFLAEWLAPVAGDLISEAGSGNELIIRADKIKSMAPNGALGGLYPDLLYTNGGSGYYDLPTKIGPGEWYICALYAAGESRPCDIVVEDKVFGPVFSKVSGSFTKESILSDICGPIVIARECTVRIRPIGLSPHFYGFIITKSKDRIASISDFE